VAQVVEADVREPGLLQQRIEAPLQEVGGVQGPPHGVGEDKPLLVPGGPELATLPALVGEMTGQRVHRDSGEQDLAAGGSRLQPPDEVKCAGVEVDIGPSEPEQLTFTHPGSEREDVQRLQPVTLDRIQEAPRSLISRQIASACR